MPAFAPLTPSLRNGVGRKKLFSFAGRVGRLISVIVGGSRSKVLVPRVEVAAIVNATAILQAAVLRPRETRAAETNGGTLDAQPQDPPTIADAPVAPPCCRCRHGQHGCHPAFRPRPPLRADPGQEARFRQYPRGA